MKRWKPEPIDKPSEFQTLKSALSLGVSGSRGWRNRSGDAAGKGKTVGTWLRSLLA